jgi:hypothetical protein
MCVPAARYHVTARILLLRKISKHAYAGTRNTEHTQAEDYCESMQSSERHSCIESIPMFVSDWLPAEIPPTSYLWKANDNPSRYEKRVATGGQKEDDLSLP